MLGLPEGGIANGELIGKALYQDLKKYYGNQGFVEYTAEVSPTFKGNPQKGNEGIVDLRVTIDEGKQFKIHSIKFSGNNLPQKVLFELLLIREGEVYNQELYEKSIEKLNDSGLFDPIDKDRDVDFVTDEAKGLVDLLIKVGGADRDTEPEERPLKRRPLEPQR
jgi:outer membrane protein assembly factor BamA